MGLVVQTKNPLAPWKDRSSTVVDYDISISQWLAEQGIEFNAPTICLYNGQAILRADWERCIIGNRDVVAFISLPQGGGGGSSVLRVVMMLAVVVASAFTMGAVGAAYGATMGALAGAGVSMLGNALISMLVPPSNGLSNLQNAALAAASPTYSLQAQGNSARLGSSIPVIYGLHRTYPDYAAQPYTEFSGNEQYLYQLFCIGQGYFDVLDMRIEDSPTSSFDEISYTLYQPNETITEFPTRVEVSGEVAGQELLTGSYIGHFYANAEGTEINKIGIDIVAPNGMYHANDDGTLGQRDAVIQIEAALANDAMQTLGDFSILLTETLSAKSPTAIRKSYKINVPLGRYAVRVTRIDAKDTSSRSSDTVLWTGMRGYYPGQQNYGDVTIVAMIMKASNNLSQSASRRVNCLVQRRLKTWDPATGWSDTPIATRSIVWAIADIAKSNYGLKLRDNQLDLIGWYALQQQYNARQAAFGADHADYCDIVIDNRVSAWDAMMNIAQCGRALPVLQGGLLRIIRDTQQTLPTAMFCGRNITKNSFKINYLMPTEQTADAVIVEWMDKNTLLPKETLATLPGSTSDNPARVKMLGISNQAQAFREAVTLASINRYRRKQISFQTELEGHIPSVGDLIAISHPMPKWGVSGEILATNWLSLSLSEPVEFTNGVDHFIALRRADGSVSGPYLCHPHSSGLANEIELDISVDVDFNINVADNKERTYFSFGKAGEVYFKALVLPPIRPRGGNIVEINCVNESELVHLAEGGLVPLPPEPWQLPTKLTKPVISRLDVAQQGTISNPILLLSWSPAANADHYLIQTSIDNANWLNHPDTTSTSCSLIVEPGLIYVRVAPIGISRGDWVTWSGTTGIIQPPGNVTGLASLESFIGSQAKIRWNSMLRASSYLVEVWALGVLRRSSSVLLPAYDYSAEDIMRDGGPWRSLTFKVFAVNDQGSSASPAEITLTNPQIGALQNITVTAVINAIVITYLKPSETDWEGVRVCKGDNSGFIPSNANVIYEGSDTVIFIANLVEGQTYYLRVAAYDHFGKDQLSYSGEYAVTLSGVNELLSDPGRPGDVVVDATRFLIVPPGQTTPKLAVFGVGNVNGTPTVGIRGDLLIDGSAYGRSFAAKSIASEKLNVMQLSALAADMGTLTAGTMKTSSGNGYRVEVSDSGGYPIWYGSGAKNGSNALFYLDDSGNAMFAGVLHGATGTFNGSLSAATGTFSGLLSGGSVNINNKFTVSLDGTVIVKNANDQIVFATGSGVSKLGMAVGTGGNMIPNSDFAAGVQNWEFGGNGGSSVGLSALTWDLEGPDWYPEGGHTIGFHRSGTTGSAATWQDIVISKKITVLPSTRYELSAYLANHRCTTDLDIEFTHLDNGVFSQSYLNIGSNSTHVGGRSLANYNRVGGFFTTAPTCVAMRPFIRASATNDLITGSPYVWATKLYLAEANPNQTELSPWSAGGNSGLFSEVNQLTSQNTAALVDPNNSQLLNSLQQWSDVQLRPTSLAALDSEAGTKLTGIATGATRNIGIWALMQDKLAAGNIDAFFESAAIHSALIGSVALVGNGNFSVKSGLTGERTEIDNLGMRIYDASDVIRVEIGKFS